MSQQLVQIGQADMPTYLAELANTATPTQQNSITAVEQTNFNQRVEKERAEAGRVPMEDVRNLYRRQNSMFRPTARVGNALQTNTAGAKVLQLMEGNQPYTDVHCALEKELRIREQVDRRIAEARSLGFKGNKTLERARALRTGTIVPRKRHGPGTKRVLGNNVVGPSGASSSTASYEVSRGESNAFLRRMTGVDFEGDKCKRMERRERNILAPTPMADPPPGYLPGGGRFLSEKERLDIVWDKPHLSGQYLKPHKPIDIHQWTDRPVSYRPPTRFNLADEIPTQEPNNAGVFMQPEPIGSRISSEQLPYNGMPGDSFGATLAQQVRAPRDESYLAKFKADIGPKEAPLPFTSDIDNDFIERSERMPTYQIVKPKIERQHLEQHSADTLERGIQLIPEDSLYDPTTFQQLGTNVTAAEREKRTTVAEKESLAASKRRVASARIIGEQSDTAMGLMQHDVTGSKAAAHGLQKENAALKANTARSDFHSRIAVSGDQEIFTDLPGVARLQRGMLSAPQSAAESCKQRMRENRSMAGQPSQSALMFDESLLNSNTRGLDAHGAHQNQEAVKRSTAAEKLSLLRARIQMRRENAFDDPEIFENITNADRMLGQHELSTARTTHKDRVQAQRNFQRVQDAMQRRRLTVTDSYDPDIDFGNQANAAASKISTSANQHKMSAKTRQLEQDMMRRAESGKKMALDEQMFGDLAAPNSLSTDSHFRDGTAGRKMLLKEAQSSEAAREQILRARLLDDSEQFESLADKMASRVGVNTHQLSGSTSAQKVKTAEQRVLERAREQMSRLNAFQDLDVSGKAHAQRALQSDVTANHRNDMIIKRESNMASNRIGSEFDGELTGNNTSSRVTTDKLKHYSESAKTQQREQASMQRGAAAMNSQNFATDLNVEAHTLQTQTDAREMDTARSVHAESKIMARVNPNLTGLDQVFEASAKQESLINGGMDGERGARARAKGRAREMEMLQFDRERRQALRPTDTDSFAHHTVDSAIGTEPYGGRASFDRRSARREEWAQYTPRQDYDDAHNVLQSEHILKRLEATHCPSPTSGLKAERQNLHIDEIIRKERGPPAHLLPAYMFPGGKKQVTPRGSPCASPIPH